MVQFQVILPSTALLEQRISIYSGPCFVTGTGALLRRWQSVLWHFAELPAGVVGPGCKFAVDQAPDNRDSGLAEFFERCDFAVRHFRVDALLFLLRQQQLFV